MSDNEFASDELEAYYHTLIRAAKQQLELSRRKSNIERKFNSKKPIAFAFTGDWQAGEVGVDYDGLLSDNEILNETDGLYVVGMGDYIHNAKAVPKTGTALYEAIFPNPDMQVKFVKKELSKLKDKTVTLLTGCHEWWDYQHAGIDTMGNICEELDIPYLAHGGIIHLELNNERYSIGVRHKYPGGKRNGGAQENFYDSYPEREHLDAVVLAHFHFTFTQKVRKRGGYTVFMRSGSYYRDDLYGQQIGGFVGEPGVPILIFFPDKHKVLPFDGTDMKEAIAILKYLRAAYK